MDGSRQPKALRAVIELNCVCLAGKNNLNRFVILNGHKASLLHMTIKVTGSAPKVVVRLIRKQIGNPNARNYADDRHDNDQLGEGKTRRSPGAQA